MHPFKSPKDSSPYVAVIEDTKYQLKMSFSKHVMKLCHRTTNSVAHELASLCRMYHANHFVEWESDVLAQVPILSRVIYLSTIKL